ILKPTISVHPEYDNVYEAEGFNHTIPEASAITVMSARPFSLHSDVRDGEGLEQMSATMTGLDEILPIMHCWPLYFEYSVLQHSKFTMEVNGPIISVIWDINPFTQHDFPPVHISATIGITNQLSLDRSGWVGSPGAHGCPGKQPYRSSLYDLSTPIHAEITTDQPRSFMTMSGTNSDTLLLSDRDGGVFYRLGRMEDGNPTVANFHTKNLTINWTPNGTGNDYLIVQWDVTKPN
ncbi:hypothetical protein PENTCL1PPCAC_21060, partial [Pristionchus entomophagus]